MAHCYLAYAFETIGWNHSDTYPLMFIQQMLGAWDKSFPGGGYHVSPLIQYLYEDEARPVAENFMAFNTPYTDTGLFGIYAKVHAYDVQYFMDAIRLEMNRLGYTVSQGMVDDVREKLKATMLLSMGNTTQVLLKSISFAFFYLSFVFLETFFKKKRKT